MRVYKIWVDDTRPMPDSYDIHFKSVNDTIDFLDKHMNDTILISLDHDAGDYAQYGGDYIHILDYLEARQILDHLDLSAFTIEIHTANAVGRENMLRVCSKNGWWCRFDAPMGRTRLVER